MEWAQRLKTYRRQMGYKQTAAAEALGVSQATLSKWERGLYEPTVAAKSQIYKAIAKDDDDLLVARQRFIIQNSGGYNTLLKPNLPVLDTMSAPSAQRFGLHPSIIDGFDIIPIAPEGQMELYEELRGSALLDDKDVVRISSAGFLFDQTIGRWIETHVSALPVHTSSGVFTNLVSIGITLIDEPEVWNREYTVHSVFGDETFSY